MKCVLSVRREAACGTHPLGLSVSGVSGVSGSVTRLWHSLSPRPPEQLQTQDPNPRWKWSLFRLEQQPSPSRPGPPRPAAWVAQPSPPSNEQKRGRPVLTTQQDCGQNTWHSPRVVMISGVTLPLWGHWQCLEMFWSQAGWACCWCLVDRGRGHCSPLPRQPRPLPHEALSSPSVSQAEVEHLGAGSAHRMNPSGLVFGRQAGFPGRGSPLC